MELKSCPFCGQVANVRTKFYATREEMVFTLGCATCGFERTYKQFTNRIYNFEDITNIMDSMVMRWNQRKGESN